MYFVLLGIYILMIIMIAGLALRSRLSKNQLNKSIFALLVNGDLTFLTAAVGLFSTHELLSTLFLGFFSNSVTFVLVSVLSFTLDYTGRTKYRRSLVIPLFALAGLEGLNFIANVHFHHIFTLTHYTFFDGDTIHIIGESSPFYIGHIVFCYLIVTIVFIMLIRKMHQAPSLYKRRYSGIIVVFLVVLVLDALGIVTEVLSGIAPLFYGMMAISIYEYAIVFAPKRLSAGLLSETIRDLEAGMLIYDLDRRLIYANDIAESTFSYRLFGDIKLNEFGDFWLSDRDPEQIEDSTWTQDTEDGDMHFEVSYKRIFDDNNKFIGFCFSILNRTVSVNNFVSEKYKATHDELTGLYNSNGFYEQVRLLLEKTPDVPRVIAVSNIKDFKLLNDLFGEERGDKVLRRIGNVMSQRCIDSDSIPARLSSDRFAICMRKDRYSDDLFSELPQQVIQLEENRLYKVVCHIGVYEITEPDIAVSTMCDRALLAVNTLKNSYTTLIAHYDSSLRDKIVREQQIIGSLQEALKNGEFQIYIQPQIQANDLTCKGGEALVRWMKPTGMIPPGDFIPVFERTGLITTLDKYVWELACEKLRQWKSLGLNDYYISVNISPRDFYYIDIYATFTSLVEKYRISPSNLHLEITETVIMNDVNKQVALLNALRAYGFHVEMDDFGSGYSSLNMLKNITVDVLKIDMGFLGETAEQSIERSRNILKMIVSLSKDLKMEIVSEGVETQDEVDFLKSIGVDVFQGYFFAKPMPIGQFEDQYVPI